MKRVVLFILTNRASILILTVVLRLLGVDRILDEQGIDLEMTNLLAFAAGARPGNRDDVFAKGDEPGVQRHNGNLDADLRALAERAQGSPRG